MSDTIKAVDTWQEKEAKRETQELADRAENQRRYEEDSQRHSAYLSLERMRLDLLREDNERRAVYFEREAVALERIASAIERAVKR